jgi:hypothetical protein
MINNQAPPSCMKTQKQEHEREKKKHKVKTRRDLHMSLFVL